MAWRAPRGHASVIVLGVTGGIASGKSTVARMLCGRAGVHINADDVVHDLFANDALLIAAIADSFPTAIVKGAVDRAALGAHIAKHPEALYALEAIVHPAVRAAEAHMIRVAQRQRRPLVVLDVPLMFESGSDHLCDAVIAVVAGRDVQARRAMARGGMSREKFDALIARQLTDAARAEKADAVITTRLGKAHTMRIVQKIRATLFS